ncbi:MAG: hypothetical protein VX498_12050, partial [Myxococcota bacterium]|nr:hypothetical protein [Myxococcota bacterium]
FLLVKGLPGFTTIVQPIKYFNFFLVPLLALLAGLGLDRLSSLRPRLAWAALPLFLAWPFIHNGTALKERFKHPVEAGPVQDFHQLAQVGHADWASWDPEEIERRGREHLLRELARPEQAREYWGAKRNVGIIDWYGTIEMDEAAIPSRYITPSGRLVDNPRYPGAEGWFSEGEGQIESLEIGPTRITARVETNGPARLVINQNHLPGFYARGGQLAEVNGLLAIDIAGPGSHQVQFRYRPMKLLLGLLGSFLGFLLWSWAVFREIRPPQAEPHGTQDAADPTKSGPTRSSPDPPERKVV